MRSCLKRLDGLTFNYVEDDEALWLERAFEESDVQEVLKVLNDDKALGPDGFPWLFSSLVGKF